MVSTCSNCELLYCSTGGYRSVSLFKIFIVSLNPTMDTRMRASNVALCATPPPPKNPSELCFWEISRIYYLCCWFHCMGYYNRRTSKLRAERNHFLAWRISQWSDVLKNLWLWFENTAQNNHESRTRVFRN